MSQISELTWPPPVNIRKHPRAKHVKIRASLKNGLELVVPKRFNLKEVPFILEQNRAWIEKQLLKLSQINSQTDTALPKEIHFHSLAQTWNIHYEKNSKPPMIITRPHHEIVLFGNIENQLRCREQLTQWLRKFSTPYLLQWLNEISREIQLPFNKAIIRDQTSRWGSCSAEKTISLNYKLIFLPYALTHHIIIHELCHTKVLNHSERFWSLVKRFDENMALHRLAMRNANQYIPGWLK